ncbi:MAG: hypothetical protein KIS77_04190 [Saprospiraceae bacterium]|nr:hypothetical protein [Saprospiraceae bacterium]
MAILVMALPLLVRCKKDANDSNTFHHKLFENGEAHLRSELTEVHVYYIDGTISSQTSYENKLAEAGVYEHIIFEPTTTENYYSHHLFSSKAGYVHWGDSLGFKISKAIYVSERLAFVADSAGLNQIDTNSIETIPEWYDSLVQRLIKEELDDPNELNFICYAVYFWQGYSETNFPAHTKFGGNAVSDARILWNNNKLSSWKPDVMTCLSNYKYGHLSAWDKWHYKKPIPNPNASFPTTITVKGDVFTPFVNIYGAWDNKISSYTSWETKNP